MIVRNLYRQKKMEKAKSIRYSETFAKKTFYYAVKLDDGNVLRVEKTVDSIYSTWISSLAVLGLRCSWY